MDIYQQFWTCHMYYYHAAEPLKSQKDLAKFTKLVAFTKANHFFIRC